MAAVRAPGALAGWATRKLAIDALAISGAGFTIALLVIGITSGRFPIPGGDYLYTFAPVGDAVRSLRDPYTLTSNLTQTFFYAPPWAFAFALISWLPPVVGNVLMATVELLSLRYIVRSWTAVGIVAWCPLLAFDLALGNINLLVGACIVAAVRGHPWAGLLGASAKLSPILAVRPSRSLLGPLAVLAVLCIPWGPSWIAALIRAAGRAPTPVDFPLSLGVRLVIAGALLAIRRPWATAAAAVIAIPAFYWQSLVVLVAPIAIYLDPRSAQPGKNVGPG
ncbi:MAG: hypothetical protein ACYDAK_05390 [Candidatus Limnocylindrales bacterium]